MATSSLVSKPFLKGSAGTDSGTRRPFSPSSFRVSVRRHQFRRLEVRAGGDIFGKYFKVATYGESHGKGVGCVISGCPPGVPLSETDMQVELDRRRPGQSRITTPRKETDTCEIRSGIHEGLTIGTPIAVFVPNTDQRGHDYEEMFAAYRPSHADATYIFKYGLSAIQGGGRSSARETIGRVAAGALAKKILKMTAGTEGQVPKLARLPSPPMITAPAPPLLRPRRLSHRPNSAPCVFIEEPFQ